MTESDDKYIKDTRYNRTDILIGHQCTERLISSSAAIFGLGGVGSYCTEALARAGIGRFLLCDNDTVSCSNINRQLIATTKTVGMKKTHVERERILDINPDASVKTADIFYSKETQDEIDLRGFDYIIDAIDTVSSKLLLIETAKRLGIPVISSMGTGNKLDPTKFEVADIHKTSVCPLARVMRQELRKRGIKDVKVVYSKEEPIKYEEISLESAVLREQKGTTGRAAPGSISFVPSVAGLIIAGEVIKDILGI